MKPEKESEQKERIRHIQKAALKLFARKGYSDCNMNEIAAEAQMGKATLYYYFPNKETLFRSLLFDESARFYKQAAERIANIQDALKAIEALMHFYIDYFHEHAELLHLFFPLGKSSPVVLKGDAQWDKKIRLLRKPIEQRLTFLLQTENLRLHIELFLQLLWTFLIGMSIKLAQGYTREEIFSEIRLFLHMLDSELNQSRSEES